MSTLDRYKKPGGFLQLLSLIETCGPAKREKFLQMISNENTDWHEAIKDRIINIEIVLNWPIEVIQEITSRSQPITLAAISKSNLSEEQINRLFHGLPHAKLSKTREIISDKAFTPNEISSSIEKLLVEIRTHIQHGVIKLEKFAPELAIPDGIEESLSKGNSAYVIQNDDEPIRKPSSQQSINSEVATKVVLNTSSSGNEDLQILKKQNLQLTQEINILRQENKLLKEKLEKIKKIA